MLVHGKLDKSSVNGPGNRAVLWTQGCFGMSCRDVCWNPATHSFIGGTKMDAYDTVQWLRSIEGIEGITFSGGEPTQQHDLVQVLKEIRLLLPHLSIGMYTGYTAKELEKRPNNLAEDIFSLIDFAVMGRFNPLKKTTKKPLCSSDNQEIVFFSDRYNIKDFKPQFVEVRISAAGDLVNITGFPVGVHKEMTEAFNYA